MAIEWQISQGLGFMRMSWGQREERAASLATRGKYDYLGKGYLQEPQGPLGSLSVHLSPQSQ
jgi:hypothetical protein